MKRMFSVGTFMAVALVVSGALGGEEPQQQPPTPTTRVRGTLPQNWNKLGLTDEQKQQIYTAKAEYQGKIDALQKQIRDLQKQQRAAMEKVLTESQKTRLRELAAEKLPKVTAPKDDKKPDAKPAAAPDKKP